MVKFIKRTGIRIASIDLTITCQYEISGAPQGKVRYYIEIENGKVIDAELGNILRQTVLYRQHKEVSSILQQEKSVSFIYARNFKIDGEYEKYLLHNERHQGNKEWQNMQQALMSFSS